MQLRDAIVAGVREVLDGVDVQPHLGRFDEEELKAFAAKAPAVRVAILGVEGPAPVNPRGVDQLVRVGIYIVTKDGAAKLSREDAAMAAVERIILKCDRARWGLPFCHGAEGVVARNLYSEGLRGQGAAMWALDLRQPIRLSLDEEEAGARLYLGVAPLVGTEHEDKYFGPVEGEAPQ